MTARVTLGVCPTCNDTGPLHGVCSKCHSALYERQFPLLWFWGLVAGMVFVMMAIVWSLG